MNDATADQGETITEPSLQASGGASTTTSSAPALERSIHRLRLIPW